MHVTQKPKTHKYKHIRNKMCLRYRVRFVYVSDSFFFRTYSPFFVVCVNYGLIFPPTKME